MGGGEALGGSDCSLALNHESAMTLVSQADSRLVEISDLSDPFCHGGFDSGSAQSHAIEASDVVTRFRAVSHPWPPLHSGTK